jgi:hypothetical protein
MKMETFSRANGIQAEIGEWIRQRNLIGSADELTFERGGFLFGFGSGEVVYSRKEGADFLKYIKDIVVEKIDERIKELQKQMDAL